MLDLGNTPDGKNDFYSGPDRLFRAHNLAREALGDAAEAAWAEGRAMTIERAVACALDHDG